MAKVDIKILNGPETFSKIKEGYSLARYGDGEFFNFILSSKGINKMQKFNKDLQKKLLQPFLNPLEKLLIGVPKRKTSKSWVSNFHKKFSKFIKDKPAYNSLYASFPSRPSLYKLDSDEYFKKVKSIWKNRRIVIVNFNLKLLHHYLFKDNDIRFIPINRRNCFDDYKWIRKKCKELYKENRIFLVSAGPVATALSYDLTVDGEQCLDIGQIAFEYSLFKNENNLEEWTSQGTFRKNK